METKAWYESKTVWAGLITVGSAVAGIFGIVVDQATQDQAIELLTMGATAIGGLAAIYGRFKATKKIK